MGVGTTDTGKCEKKKDRKAEVGGAEKEIEKANKAKTASNSE